ncbi:MAG: DUF6541 family protein [Enhygromyxa sp.]
MISPRAVHGPPRTSRAAWWALAFAFVMLLIPRVAEASRPVITPDREAEIIALVEPYALGDELAPGWTLHSFAIAEATIRIWVAGPEGSYAELTLDHPDHGGIGARSIGSFAVAEVQRPPGSEAAIATLCATLERNDDGSFWLSKVAFAEEEPPSTDSRPSLADRIRALGSHIEVEAMADWALAWARDGLVLLTLFTVILLGLVAHKLRGAELWMKVTLVAIVVGGAVLRSTLSPRISFEPWPYSRVLMSARLIYDGPGLAALYSGRVWVTDATLTSTLVLALLAPLAVYVHARYLLDDHRAALIVAGIMAVLPLHLRFTHTNVAFIPSITVSSVVFTLVHVATREQSKRLGWFAVAVIGLPLALVYLVRPLNIMYFALLIGTAFVNHGIYSEKPKIDRVRTGVAFTIITLVTVLGGIPWLFEGFSSEVDGGLRWETLARGWRVLVSTRDNALLNPTFTPPGLVALAVIGVVSLWRRRKRPLLWFLVLWLLGFLIAHAYVIPPSPYMQARYHLHLIVPFMLLAACGAEAVLRWLAAQRERSPWLAGWRYHGAITALVVYVCASPWIHRDAIQTTEFNDAHEWLFVHSLRAEIPERCHVVEYTGFGAGARFARIGAYVEAGTPGVRYEVHAIRPPADGGPELPADVRALLMDPPECLYWYEGLSCFGVKPKGASKAPVCDVIEGFVALEEVAMTSFDSVEYDPDLAQGLEPGDRIELRLFRAFRRRRD